jgi:hypothetical protein
LPPHGFPSSYLSSTEEAVLPELLERMTRVLDELAGSQMLVFFDEGSSDR